jgi:hypothetical protein
MIAEPSSPAAPVGQQGTSRARRRAGCGARRVARGPLPIDYGDGPLAVLDQPTRD